MGGGCLKSPASRLLSQLFVQAQIKDNTKASLAFSLRWHHNGRDSVSNDQPHDCFLNRLFRHRSKKTSKLRVTGLCVGNSPEADEFPTQVASNAENVSIWWRHHVWGESKGDQWIPLTNNGKNVSSWWRHHVDLSTWYSLFPQTLYLHLGSFH